MSDLVRYQKHQLIPELTIATQPQDAPRILAILQLLAEYGGNKNPDVRGVPMFIEIGTTYQLVSYPGTRSPVVYISYDAEEHKLSTCPKHVLIRAIANTISKVSDRDEEFEELASKYKGADFLAQLFGLGGARSFLMGTRSLSGTPEQKQINHD